jgi:hypothetical protein
VKISPLIFAVLVLCRAALAQGFVNLNFEQSAIVSSSPSGSGFNWGIANVPDWAAYDLISSNFTGGTTVLYNRQGLDNPSVSLIDSSYWTPALQGKYSVLLFGGSNAAESTNGASISQTGQIPITARSITYWGSSWNNQQNLQITFNSQMLSFIVVSNTAKYTIYGADISTYAGQTGELLFTAPWQSYGNVIDSIVFSSNSVPEPNTCILTMTGLVLLFRRRRVL